jgi:glycosyltransferase involved in cell wall biosynthesis
MRLPLKNNNRPIFLVAPNVSEQMGGEAIKALQIFKEFKKINRNTIQITHERCEADLSGRLNLRDVYYVRDTWVARFIWRSVILRPLLDIWFSSKAVKLAEQMAKKINQANRSTVIHQTEPNSPVVIRKLSNAYLNVLGPINGNIYYPKLFRHNETFGASARRRLHFPIQHLSAFFFRRSKKADLILAAGGNRTIESLIAAGYPTISIKDVIDCGIPDALLDRPRIKHERHNFHFVHYGRLVHHKGIFLAIEAIKKADLRVNLDIIGTGPELGNCRSLVQKLGLDRRVRFLGWKKSHQELLDSLQEYRGMVFPSFQEANGIVVQEALAIGLPVICLNWGGPQLLIENAKTGFLIDPTTREDVILKIAAAFDMLSIDPELAERISIAGREQAEAWRWSNVANAWITLYPDHKNSMRNECVSS